MVPEGINITGSSVENVPSQRGEAKRVELEEKPAPKKVEEKPITEKLENFNAEIFKNAVEELNHNIKMFNSQLSFSVDDNTGKTVIKVSERETNKVIREIPPEALLRLASKLNEIIGMMFDLKI